MNQTHETRDDPALPAPADDERIGKAARASAIGAVCIAMIVLTIVWLAHRRSVPAAHVTEFAAPRARVPMINPPTVRFTDITTSAGIHFSHQNGAYGEKLLPETMGGGVAFFDYDNDGLPDLLLVNGAWWPGHEVPHAKPPTMALYHNDGGGHFTDVTAGSGLDVSMYGMGVAVGDYDNDGLVDLLITGVGGCRLFHNEGGGKFREVTREAGVGGSAGDWSTSAAFIDYDNDGWLDLFVCNYVRWSRELDLRANYTMTGIGRAYGPPNNFEGSFCRLYHNEGNGKFADVSAAAGIQVRNKDTGLPVGKSLGVAPIDIDGDGYMDLVVANDTVQNFLFHNKRDGTFEEIGAAAGIGFDAEGRARGAMGIDAAYLHNDDRLAIGVGNFANESMGLYVSHSSGEAGVSFSDDAVAEGLDGSTRLPLKFGTVFFDYDLDGWLDLLLANGHIEQEISSVQAGETYAQSAQLYWNGGLRGIDFVQVGRRQAGPDLFKPIAGRACAVADIDGDGDLDLILTQIDGPPLLLRNDQKTGHNWIRLKLIGVTCNRDAIGAWVIATVNGHVLRRQVMPTRGYLSQSELPVTIGLGDATRLDALEVRWPGGKSQNVENPKIDALTVVVQQP